MAARARCVDYVAGKQAAAAFCKTLAPGSKPRLETVFKLLRALGVKLNAVPASVAAA
ncbi:hypothetical protein [Paraburkholderia sp.]|uniref:hypothetical protein n=1 Tax=Paraburkholderia sp. TaxID=1926495 RepID=UPI0039E350BC